MHIAIILSKRNQTQSTCWMTPQAQSTKRQSKTLLSDGRGCLAGYRLEERVGSLGRYRSGSWSRCAQFVKMWQAVHLYHVHISIYLLYLDKLNTKKAAISLPDWPLGLYEWWGDRWEGRRENTPQTSWIPSSWGTCPHSWPTSLTCPTLE